MINKFKKYNNIDNAIQDRRVLYILILKCKNIQKAENYAHHFVELYNKKKDKGHISFYTHYQMLWDIYGHLHSIGYEARDDIINY